MKGSFSSSSSLIQQKQRRKQQQQQQQQQEPRRSKSDVKVYLPGRRYPIIRQRSILFDEEVSVLEIRPAVTLVRNKSKKNINDNDNNNENAKTNNPESILWFQQDEYDTIRNKNFRLISRIKKEKEIETAYNNNNDSNTTTSNSGVSSKKKYCTRGLERLICREESLIKREQAEDAVFTEQYLQHEDGIYSVHQIADQYRTISCRSQAEARNAGKEDAMIAEHILGTKFENRKNQHHLHRSTTCRGSTPLSSMGSRSFHVSSSRSNNRKKSSNTIISENPHRQHQQQYDGGGRRSGLKRCKSM